MERFFCAPPTINHVEGDEDPEIDYTLNYTFNKAQKREVRAARRCHG